MKTLFITTCMLMSICVFGQTKEQFTVNFDFDSPLINSKTGAQLDSFVSIKRPHPVYLYLYGHCDSMGSNSYNDLLSYKRVAAIKEFLIAQGFDHHLIIEQKGFGKRKPLNHNLNAYERLLNRRVEIVVEENEIAINQETEQVTITEKIIDTATKVGTNIVLKNMNFYGGTHIILPESFPILMELATVMKQNPLLEIAIEGHICCQVGDADGLDLGTHTLNLSENRAKVICEYLFRNGINQKRLQYKGFGHQQPIVAYPEKTEQERTTNRRVEIKIIKK